MGVDCLTTSPDCGKHFNEHGHDTHDPREAAKMLVNAVLAGVPGAREAPEQGGLGLFTPPNPLDDLMQGSTGISVRTPH